MSKEVSPQFSGQQLSFLLDLGRKKTKIDLPEWRVEMKQVGQSIAALQWWHLKTKEFKNEYRHWEANEAMVARKDLWHETQIPKFWPSNMKKSGQGGLCNGS